VFTNNTGHFTGITGGRGKVTAEKISLRLQTTVSMIRTCNENLTEVEVELANYNKLDKHMELVENI